MDISSSAAWQALVTHQQQIANIKMADEFASDPDRFTNFSLAACGLLLDYSKNRITAKTLQYLGQLAETANLSTQIENMFAGKKVNITENRAVLHTALRNPNNQPLYLDQENIIPQIHQVLSAIEKFSAAISNGSWLGYSKKAITDVVNIGIGGSDLGPAMVTRALSPYTHHKIKVHFVSNIDSSAINEILQKTNPQTTLFIVASKTFTTTETLVNAQTAKKWLWCEATNANDAVKHHFIAVTANPERAQEFGIEPTNILPFWDWVGGRFSLWSAIGLSIAIAIGMDNFRELLAGAFAMDQHFRQAPLLENMPVIMGLLSIWNINFWQTKAQAIIPYDQYLELFPSFLQQLIMESNGKQITIDGTPTTYATAPVIFGSVGTNGQHAFHQAIMQGTQLIPVDFIISRQSQNPIDDHHLILYANCLAQSQALMQGCSKADVIKKLTRAGLSTSEANKLAPHQIIRGNVPSNTILIDKLTPKTLGSLLALYEHQVLVQGVIWQINSFDQWGVELGKKLAKQIIPLLPGKLSDTKLDSSTQNLIQKYSTGV